MKVFPVSFDVFDKKIAPNPSKTQKEFWSIFGPQSGLKLTENIVLFGCEAHFKADCVFDLILLSAKFYVYSCRFNNSLPNLKIFVQKLKNRYAIENHIASMDMCYNTFLAKWNRYLNIINEETV